MVSSRIQICHLATNRTRAAATKAIVVLLAAQKIKRYWLCQRSDQRNDRETIDYQNKSIFGNLGETPKDAPELPAQRNHLNLFVAFRIVVG